MKNLRSSSLPQSMRAQLRAARRAQGLSQSALGELVGLAQKHISGIENGHVVPRYDTLLDLLRALGLDMVVVPRQLTPLVQSLSQQSQTAATTDGSGSGVEPAQRSLYAWDGEDDDLSDDQDNKSQPGDSPGPAEVA